MKTYCTRKGLFHWEYVTVYSRTEIMTKRLKESISSFWKKLGFKKSKKKN